MRGLSKHAVRVAVVYAAWGVLDAVMAPGGKVWYRSLRARFAVHACTASHRRVTSRSYTLQQLRRPLCSGTVAQAKQRCTDLRAQLDQLHSQIKALDPGQEPGGPPTEVRTIPEAHSRSHVSKCREQEPTSPTDRVGICCGLLLDQV